VVEKQFSRASIERCWIHAWQWWFVFSFSIGPEEASVDFVGETVTQS
jgi:hypothetical protein